MLGPKLLASLTDLSMDTTLYFFVSRVSCSLEPVFVYIYTSKTMSSLYWPKGLWEIKLANNIAKTYIYVRTSVGANAPLLSSDLFRETVWFDHDSLNWYQWCCFDLSLIHHMCPNGTWNNGSITHSEVEVAAFFPKHITCIIYTCKRVCRLAQPKRNGGMYST